MSPTHHALLDVLVGQLFTWIALSRFWPADSTARRSDRRGALGALGTLAQLAAGPAAVFFTLSGAWAAPLPQASMGFTLISLALVFGAIFCSGISNDVQVGGLGTWKLRGTVVVTRAVLGAAVALAYAWPIFALGRMAPAIGLWTLVSGIWSLHLGFSDLPLWRLFAARQFDFWFIAVCAIPLAWSVLRAIPGGRENARNEAPQPEAVLAAEEGRLEDLQRLAKKPRVLVVKGQLGLTPLMAAAVNGHLDCVRWLLAQVPNAALDRDNCERTALMLAAAGGHAGCVEALAPHSDPAVEASHWTENGRTAMALAARGGHIECVDALLRGLGDRAALANHAGQTPLFAAAEGGSAQMVRRLLALCNPRKADNEGRTALMIAALHGKDEAVDALLPHSDPQALDAKGGMAIDYALSNGKLHARAIRRQLVPPAAGPASAAMPREIGRCADLLAPLSPRKRVDEAFAFFGAVGMPGWAAGLEREELLGVLRAVPPAEAAAEPVATPETEVALAAPVSGSESASSGGAITEPSAPVSTPSRHPRRL